MSHNTISDLLQQIEEAFANVRSPRWDEVATVMHRWEFTAFYDSEPVYDWHSVPPEHLECKFSDWHDLPLELLECQTSVFSFVEPKGFLFFFPAFLRCGLLQYEECILSSKCVFCDFNFLPIWSCAFASL